MVQFENFFEVPDKMLKVVGIVVDSNPPINKREKIKFLLRDLYFLLTVKTVLAVDILIAVFLYQHFDDLSESDSAWSNFFVVSESLVKTLYLRLYVKEINALMMKLKALFEAARCNHSERYDKNFRFINRFQKMYTALLYGE
jgi:hypothetical protein